MFNHLIESSSHAKEFKRRGSFVLFTTSVYLVLFAVTGVVSIYAYDAHLEAQDLEISILTFAPPLPAEEPAPAPPRNTIPANSNNNQTTTRSTRTDMVASASDPTKVPPDVGVVAGTVPPARPDSVRGLVNADPIGPGSNKAGTPNGTGTGNGPIVEMEIPPPPATPTPTPEPVKLLKKSVIMNSEAISLPKPRYPQMAIQIRLQGVVNVQVLIDEQGNVVSAKAVSGHPMLAPEAQRAALQAKFSPTVVSGQRVKVSGVISYNFTMSN
jgi:protein TonB